MTSAARQEPSYLVRHAKALAQVYSKLLRLHRIKLSHLEEKLYQHYISKLGDLDEVDIVGAIKCSIATFVARRFRQKEMPEKKKGLFHLFPKVLKQIINVKTNISRSRMTDKKKAIRFIWSIAQAKRGCADVHELNCKQQLESFEKMIFSGGESSETVQNELFELGKKFGKIVNQIYDPTVFSYPGSSATLECSRKKGGTKAYIKEKMLDKNFREEPFCILIHGEPGVGKTTFNKQIVQHFAERLGLPDDCVYTRTCNTDHWDGYHGQYFTIIDDFGQNLEYKDVIEMITLVSQNHYVLPMAKLNEKGMKFSSKVIILNTNHKVNLTFNFGNSVETTVFNKEALYRRFNASIHIKARRENNFSITYNKNGLDWIVHMRTGKFSQLSPEETISRSELSKRLFSDYLDHSGKWMLEGGVSDCYSQFGHILKKERMSHWVSTTEYPEDYIVTPVALKEPLKVRVITKGPGTHAVLGSFQKALWKSLTIFEPEVFALTHGKLVQDLDTSLEDGEKYMSIDYTSSTDCIYQDCSESLLRGILESISHVPTKRYALKGLKAIVNGRQATRGQMMGWRISFPLLCLINYYIVKKSGFRKFYINGDDALAIGNDENIKIFNATHQQVGFEKSIGKNFISEVFGTINSQIVVKGKYLPYYNLLVAKRSDTYQTFGEAQKAFNIPYIIRENKEWLKQTPLSLFVAKTHGGIGYKNLKERKIDRKIYAINYYKNLNKPHVTPRGKFFKHPEGKQMALDTYENFLEEQEPVEKSELNNRMFIKLWKRFKNRPGVREFVKQGKLFTAPTLSFGFLPSQVELNLKDFVKKNHSHVNKFKYQITTKDQINGLLKVRRMIRPDTKGHGAEIRAV